MSSAFPAPTKAPTIGVTISGTDSKMNTGSPRLQKEEKESNMVTTQNIIDSVGGYKENKSL